MGIQFEDLLNTLEPSEPGVDCGVCQLRAPLTRPEYPRPWKCCAYQPFWPSFFVGAFLRDTGRAPVFHPETVFLPIGVVPPWTRRLRQEAHTDSEKAVDPLLKCSHFQSATGACGIFHHRPLECRRYFCASGSQKRSAFREEVFLWASASIQKELYSLLILQGHYSEGDWASWVSYLDPRSQGVEPHVNGRLPETDALELYRSSVSWWRESVKSIDVSDIPVLEADV